MNFATKPLQGLAVSILLASSAMALEPIVQVQKANGTTASYKLLPVHHDPSHEALVNARHASATVLANLPSKF